MTRNVKGEESESRGSCQSWQQLCLFKQLQKPEDLKKARLKDAARLRMQSWKSKLVGRSISEKTEMVPVGVKGDSLGQYHHRAIYTDAEIEEVFFLWDQEMTVAQIARKMEMPRSTVWAICHGKLRGKTPEGWSRRHVRG